MQMSPDGLDQTNRNPLRGERGGATVNRAWSHVKETTHEINPDEFFKWFHLAHQFFLYFLLRDELIN